MPQFSKQSEDKLNTCHKDIQRVMREVIKQYDFTVLEGTRTQEQQMKYFAEGKSKLDGVNQKSKHQSNPSMAIDIAPYPIDWNNAKRFYYLAGLVLATAKAIGVQMRWGGDWDADGDFADQTFNDYPHFELI